MRIAALFLPVFAFFACAPAPDVPSQPARATADYAVATYSDAAIATLAELVRFRTVHQDAVANAENPEFRALAAYLEDKARQLNFDFADHGAVVVIGLGESQDRLGVVTHADVQPVDPSKWAADPFTLDTVSEPGRLVARGSQDDKGPIATALYAMKAVSDEGPPLNRRIELIISFTEESDWRPFQEFLADAPPPALNVALDSEYPVVTAEKGWNSVHLSLPPVDGAPARGPRLIALEGGFFLSQVPADAEAVVADPTPELEARLQAAADRDTAVRYEFVPEDGKLTITATGLAAHSSQPWAGRNAITHLAALLGSHDWPDTQAARMVRLINDLVGTGDYGEKFGEVAFEHPFMGPLTLTLATLTRQDDALVAGINLRSPVGRSADELERLIRETIDGWKARSGIDELDVSIFTSEAHYLEDAPHIPVLLDIFSFYTGRPDPQPIAIGGGTHARLLPNGVNFGPSMPDEPYTGHSEHEFMTREQFLLNLRMYTAMLVELGARPASG